MRVETVIFDFDYTLADASAGIVACIDYAFGRLHLPCVAPDVARRTIGLSLPHTLVALAGAEQAEKAEVFSRLFVEHADRIMVDMTTLLPGVHQTVGQLRNAGVGLGIVSTKYRYRIQATLQREGLSGSFDVVVGGEDVSELKPDPQGLLMAMARLGGEAETTLYVGDSVTDAVAAARAEIPFVAILSGVTPREAFREHPVYATIGSLPELLVLVDGPSGEL